MYNECTGYDALLGLDIFRKLCWSHGTLVCYSTSAGVVVYRKYADYLLAYISITSVFGF